MICLTGDVHHPSLKNDDARFLDGSEVEAAIEYARIVARADLRVTLFVTGKALQEEPENVQRLQAVGNVELAGHTYHAFKPKWLYHGLFKRLAGSVNGPSWYQSWEIRKTAETFRTVLGQDMASWRDHAYRRDAHTYRLLEKHGIKVVSDDVDPGKLHPEACGAMTSVPINVLPDHDHVYHGAITPNMKRHGPLVRDKFPPDIYPIAEWGELVKAQVTRILEQGGTATVLAHPACMKIADGFRVFEELCQFMKDHPTSHISDLRPPSGPNGHT